MRHRNLLITVATSISFWLTACNTTSIAPISKGSINAEADCIQVGGEWTRVTLRGSLVCVLKTKDAGKSCINSSQCEERCLAVTDPKDSSKVIGQCQTTNQSFGCFTEMENGVPGTSLCID